MSNITFAITENIAVIGNGTKGWQKEVNMVSWNGGEPKVDIRDWAPEHEKMGKGITLTDEEAKALADALTSHFGGFKGGAIPAAPSPKASEAPAAVEPSGELGKMELTPEQLEIIKKAKALMGGTL